MILKKCQKDALDTKTPAEACEPATSSLLKVRSCAFLLAVAWAWTLAAVEFTVGQMPVSPFADTEVSTNMAINKADVSYVDLTFAFCGTPTNDLEMAFGTDADANGVLDAEEVETRFGWRMGRFFIENARTCERFDSAATDGAQDLSVELRLDVRTPSQRARGVAVSGADASAFGELVSGRPPSWLWRREWNLMRVTRRGAEPPSDWLRYKAANAGFVIVVS